MIFTAVVVATSLSFAGDELTPVERAAGWRSYTGTHASTLWRGYNAKEFPARGWRIEDGTLMISKGGGGGDIMTVDSFGDFEMLFSFKLGKAANSGIMWRVKETEKPSYMTGPEYQLLEDGTFPPGFNPGQSCGAMYDLYVPQPAAGEMKKMKPADEWNEGRIYLRNGVIQHWINGVKIVDGHIFDDSGNPTAEWASRIAKSKFADAPGFGVQPSGHIAIQDHGDTELSLKNVKIRDLSATRPGEVDLFNGKDFSGWTTCLPGASDPLSAWTIDRGVLVCKGQPIGYIRTTEKYTNFVLRLQWRFDPAKGAGNSGVLVRMVGDDKVWPKSVEAQLQSGSAGDFWNIDEFKMTVDPARTNGRNTRKLPTATPVERPLGEWNEYEIIVNKGDVVLSVNGQELNRATNVDEVPGFICLQSEGAEIHFRNIRLVPLD